MQQTEREHRAQTNTAVLCGVITKLAYPKIIANKETGEVFQDRNTQEPLMVTSFTVRVNDNFVECEALGALSRAMLGTKVGETVALTGRFEIRTNKVEKDDGQFTYQNPKFKVVDRTLDYNTKEPIPDAVPPIQLIEAGAKQFLEIRAVGTLAKDFKTMQVGNRVKAYGSIAVNGSKPNQPTWFDLSGWDSLVGDMLAIPAKSLVEIRASIRFYQVDTPFGGTAKKTDLNLKSINVIAKNAAAPASTGYVNLSAQSAATAANLLAMLDEPRAERSPEYSGSIDPHAEYAHTGNFDPADYIAEAAPVPAKRSRAKRNSGELANAA